MGTEFDSVTGRGGDDETPLRRTPWGEIAWHLRREASFAAVAEHERTLRAPAADVIRKMLPKDRPTVTFAACRRVRTKTEAQNEISQDVASRGSRYCIDDRRSCTIWADAARRVASS